MSTLRRYKVGDAIHLLEDHTTNTNDGVGVLRAGTHIVTAEQDWLVHDTMHQIVQLDYVDWWVFTDKIIPLAERKEKEKIMNVEYEKWNL